MPSFPNEVSKISPEFNLGTIDPPSSWTFDSNQLIQISVTTSEPTGNSRLHSQTNCLPLSRSIRSRYGHDLPSKTVVLTRNSLGNEVSVVPLYRSSNPTSRNSFVNDDSRWQYEVLPSRSWNVVCFLHCSCIEGTSGVRR